MSPSPLLFLSRLSHRTCRVRYYNGYDDTRHDVLVPSLHPSRLQLWNSYFLRFVPSYGPTHLRVNSDLPWDLDTKLQSDRRQANRAGSNQGNAGAATGANNAVPASPAAVAAGAAAAAPGTPYDPVPSPTTQPKLRDNSKTRELLSELTSSAGATSDVLTKEVVL
jgi:hypothetical protein